MKFIAKKRKHYSHQNFPQFWFRSRTYVCAHVKRELLFNTQYVDRVS